MRGGGRRGARERYVSGFTVFEWIKGDKLL